MELKITKCERLEGTINISGSKNTALPILAASLLSSKTVILKNIPLITDVLLMLEILKSMGVKVKRENNKVKICAKHFNPMINSNDVQKFRGSYYLIGVCLARYGLCSIKLPGGCNFMARPIDVHINVFKDLGFAVSQVNETLYIKKATNRMNSVCINKKSVGATINALLSCQFKKIPIEINNCSLEPEVIETIKFLKKLGINIVVEQNTIYLKEFKIKRNVNFKIITDRIETGSFMLLTAAIPNSKLILKNVPVDYIANIIKVVEQIGCDVILKKNTLVIKSNTVKSIDLEVSEYPSFPTDLQQILSVVLLNANNTSSIKDNIYPERISHINEVKKMNANTDYVDNKIIINNSNLTGTRVVAKDLRCAFALIVAGSIATGITIIEKAEILLRGYEKPLIKLKKIGINISE